MEVRENGKLQVSRNQKLFETSPFLPFLSNKKGPIALLYTSNTFYETLSILILI